MDKHKRLPSRLRPGVTAFLSGMMAGLMGMLVVVMVSWLIVTHPCPAVDTALPMGETNSMVATFLEQTVAAATQSAPR